MRLFFGIIVLFTILGACSSSETANYEVGDDFLDNNIAIRYIDTFTVNTGTFKLDELITSGTSRILLGHVNEQVFGNLTTNSYFQLSTSNFTIDDDAVYDSIGLVMNYDKYYYGDTLVNQTYKLYRVTETFEPDEDNDEDDFYNYSTLEYEDTSLGDVTFKPRPMKGDSIYMPVSDILGEEIFDKIKDNEIISSDDFIQEYKGFAIFPDSTSVTTSNILGFNASTTENITGNTSLRVYYTVEDGDSEDNSYYIDLVITSTDDMFNHIRSDFADSLEDSENTLSSTDTEDQIYIQGGSGVSGRISIPGLKKLNEAYEFGAVLDAELTFKPTRASYLNPENSEDLVNLQDSLYVYVVNKNNEFQAQLLNAENQIIYAVLNEDIAEFNNYHYSINMNSFVTTVLNSETDLDYHLMIQFNDLNQAPENLIIDTSDNNNDDRVKLSIKYLNY